MDVLTGAGEQRIRTAHPRRNEPSMQVRASQCEKEQAGEARGGRSGRGSAFAGCSATPGPTPAAAAPASAAPHTEPMPGGALSDTSGRSPADVALQLEALLGQHSVLVADMMRSRIRNDADFAQAASTAVTRNTDDLTAVVKAMFGDQAATAFRGTWTDHVTAFFNYARGLAANDTAARDDARAQLVKFESGLGDFFSAASQGRLPAGRRQDRPHRARRPPPPAGRRVRRPRLRPRRRRLPHRLLPRVRHRADVGRHAAAARPGGAAQPAVVAAALGARPAAGRAHRAGRRHAARRGDREPGLPGRRGEPRQEHRRPHRRDGHALRGPPQASSS